MDRVLQRRAEIDSAYRQHLANVTGIRCMPRFATKRVNNAYFPIFVDRDFPLSRDQLYQRLKQDGIHGRRYFYPLISEFPMYRGLPSSASSNLAVASRMTNQVICLPIYPNLHSEDIEKITGVIAMGALNG